MQTICTNGSSFTVDAVLVFDQTNICRNQSSIQPLLHAICTREIERLADWQKSANSHHVRHSTPQMRNRRMKVRMVVAIIDINPAACVELKTATSENFLTRVTFDKTILNIGQSIMCVEEAMVAWVVVPISKFP